MTLVLHFAPATARQAELLAEARDALIIELQIAIAVSSCETTDDGLPQIDPNDRQELDRQLALVMRLQDEVGPATDPRIEDWMLRVLNAETVLW